MNHFCRFRNTQKSKIQEIVKSNLQEKPSFSDYSKREFLRYEICKFSISSWNNLPKIELIIQKNLENSFKTLEQNLKDKEDFNAYNLCKLELKKIYDKKEEGAKIRSKCEWYQNGEKRTRVLFEYWKIKDYKCNSKTLNWWRQRH